MGAGAMLLVEVNGSVETTAMLSFTGEILSSSGEDSGRANWNVLKTTMSP